MNKVSKEILDQMVKDWQNEFTGLIRYQGGQKIVKRVGPAVIGIELEKYLSDTYRPRFILYNLLDNSSSKLNNGIDQTIKNRKGNDVTIRYDQHAALYKEACAQAKEQSRISLLKESLTLEDVIIGILTYIEKDALGNPFPSCLAVMQMSRMLESQNPKDWYFDKAVTLLQAKVPAPLLDSFTKGTEKWVEKNKSLTVADLKTVMDENCKKHKFENIPSTPYKLEL